VLSIVAKLACAGSAAALVCASVASAQTPAPPAADYTAAGSGVAVRYLGGSADDASTLSYRVGRVRRVGGRLRHSVHQRRPGAPAVGTEFLLAGAGGSPLSAGSTGDLPPLQRDARLHLLHRVRGAERRRRHARDDGRRLGPGVAFRRRVHARVQLRRPDGDEAPLSDWDYDDVRFEAANVAVTPEPATVALMGAGLLGLAAAARRRQVARRA
jgi:hypothetical protein